MGIISRGTVFSNGTSADATEVNAEFDTIHTLVNGNIDNSNISGSANIAATKVAEIPPARVLDHADTDAEYVLPATSPGTTASPSRPSSLEGELDRIRWRFQANNKSLFAQYMDAAGVAQSLGWVEPSPSGFNYLPNDGFETKTSSTATDPPENWTKENSPTDLSIVTTAATEFGENKRSLRITGTTSDGISYTVGGLKKSTKYLVGMAYVRVSGTVRIQTTGGVSGAAYQNLSLTANSGTSATYMQGVVQTADPIADLKIIINCGAAATEFRVYQVWIYELADRTALDLPKIPMRTATYSTADDTVTNTGAGAWATLTGLSLSQYIPCLGYRLVYEVTISYKTEDVGGSANEYEYAFRIQEDNGGGAATVEGPYTARGRMASSNEFGGGTIVMRHVRENPTPGATYTLTTNVWTKGNGSNDADTIIFNPTVGGGGDTVATVSKSRLFLERM